MHLTQLVVQLGKGIRLRPKTEQAAKMAQEYSVSLRTAFRHTILEFYDYRCAACGIRVKISEELSLVQAAHLIPFGLSRNDKPDNGVALCPNHHWAMDRWLIAPCPDSKNRAGVWRVGPALDPRIEGQKDLVALQGQRVIPPTEEKFYPAQESLRWREQRLSGKY